jgi:hypothetical protein
MSLSANFVADWLFDYLRMVINIDEVNLHTVAQFQSFLDATQVITFTVVPVQGGQQRYAHNQRGRPTVPFASNHTSADIEFLLEMDRADEFVLPPLQIAGGNKKPATLGSVRVLGVSDGV